MTKINNSLTLAILAKQKLRTAIAWGFKDNESIGYTDEEKREIFKCALSAIEALETDLLELKCFTKLRIL